MIACLDVDYRGDEAAAACVLAAGWADEAPTRELVERVLGVAPYVPGQFYKRELPCLLAVLRRVAEVIRERLAIQERHPADQGEFIFRCQLLPGSVRLTRILRHCPQF